MWRHVEAAATGHTGVVLVAGEPGIGKTRLLNAVAARAAGAGVLVLRGGASAAEGMPPYLPFLEAFGRYIRSAPVDALRRETGPLAAVLATILPELPLRLGEAAAGYPLPPEQARLRLYEAVAELLLAVARSGVGSWGLGVGEGAGPPQPPTPNPQPPRTSGLLLVLDDLHWADPATLDLLCYAARHLGATVPAAPVLIMGAYREGEVVGQPAFGRAVAELNRLRVLTTVRLRPLTAEEVDALAAGYLGAPVDAPAARLLFAQSEGNPFFVEELLRGWLETGTLARPAGDGGRLYALAAGVNPALPPGIVGAVRERLTRLAPDVIDLLRTAAIIGRTFNVELLAEAVGQEQELVEQRLRAAERAWLLRADQSGAFTFSHDTIRECLYESVTAVRRRQLHGFIGRALEAQAAPAGAHRLSELAFHYARSGDRARGAAYALRAAEQAARAYAPDEALVHYRAALRLLDDGDGRRGEALLALGEAAILAGAAQEAVGAFEAARAWFEQAGEPLAAAQATHHLGQAWWRQERIAQARQAFEGALALLENRPGPELVRVLVDLDSLLVVSLHRYADGIAHVRKAAELAERLSDARLLATANRALGNLLVRSNNLAAGIPLLERALALADGADDPVEAVECCACLTTAYFWQGAIGRSYDIVMRRLAFARRCHDPYELRHAYTFLGVLDALRGRWQDAEQWLDRARTAVERQPSPEPRAYLLFCAGAMGYYRGDHAAAEAQLQEAIAIFRAIGPDALVWYLGMLGLVQARRARTRRRRRAWTSWKPCWRRSPRVPCRPGSRLPI